ncbi:Hypothetical_protein [Hexamita inflata]|uniref:Hypothetical_protein n=1 Tax=Hexamita inflata TaxID=28002 RepID=A0AA86PPZ7_9EUKA|nr:Hypothetical protein HINF_LOCUS26544 [Hexamita inflata]
MFLYFHVLLKQQTMMIDKDRCVNYVYDRPQLQKMQLKQDLTFQDQIDCKINQNVIFLNVPNRQLQLDIDINIEQDNAIFSLFQLSNKLRIHNSNVKIQLKDKNSQLNLIQDATELRIYASIFTVEALVETFSSFSHLENAIINKTAFDFAVQSKNFTGIAENALKVQIIKVNIKLLIEAENGFGMFTNATEATITEININGAMKANNGAGIAQNVFVSMTMELCTYNLAINGQKITGFINTVNVGAKVNIDGIQCNGSVDDNGETKISLFVQENLGELVINSATGVIGGTWDKFAPYAELNEVQISQITINEVIFKTNGNNQYLFGLENNMNNTIIVIPSQKVQTELNGQTYSVSIKINFTTMLPQSLNYNFKTWITTFSQLAYQVVLFNKVLRFKIVILILNFNVYLKTATLQLWPQLTLQKQQ